MGGRGGSGCTERLAGPMACSDAVYIIVILFFVEVGLTASLSRPQCRAAAASCELRLLPAPMAAEEALLQA